MRSVLSLLLACVAIFSTAAQVPENLVADGIPPIPPELRAETARYLEFRAAVFHGWMPHRREMLISTRFADTAQLHLVKMPGGARRQITFGAEPVSSGVFQPEIGQCLVYSQDSGGGEFYQLYRLDLSDGRTTLLTDGKSRNTGPKWSHDGQFLAYTSTRRTGRDTDVRVMNPLDPASDHEALQVSGGGWGVLAWSHDRKKLLLVEEISANESYLHLFDLATGKTDLITPRGGEKIAWDGGSFALDDASIFTVTDHGSEFGRLVRFDLAARTERVLTAAIPWDITDFELSPNGKLVACIANEAGVSVLRMLNAESGMVVAQPKLPLGVVSNVKWNGDGELGFSLNSARSPMDAWSLDVAAGALTRWTESETGGLDPAQFSEPELVQIPSFDGVKVSGFLYRPNAKKFPGPRPCMVVIHGGPEGQSLPTFQGRSNFYLNELGIALFYPNVRGSVGYGKTFLALDNGMKREDSVRDIGSFLDALMKDPALDPARFTVIGGSYGGYMSLACMTHFSDRLRCGIDIVGISNFVSFLKNTQDYRRDLRRVEYGDERDPAMAEFLTKTAPLNNVDKITRPLMVVQGKNDPRVPVTEAEQMVKALRARGGTCWYLLANDEGHGFAKKKNADFQFLAQILFLRENLLKADAPKTGAFSPAEWLIVPLRIHLLSSKDTPALQTTLSEQDLARILPKMNKVWGQAGIQFRIESIVREEVPPLGNADVGAREELPARMPVATRAEAAFDIYYVKQLDVNGFYMPLGIFVKDTAALRPVEGGIDEPIPRVTSHEIGHALSLPHRQDTTNLMASGTTGTLLNEAEIQQTRAASKKFPWIKPAPAVLQQADELFDTGKKDEARALYRALAALPQPEARAVERAKE
jgi:dipeptidyl aminopeptidase/acylaminoacyl peptidase